MLGEKWSVRLLGGLEVRAGSGPPLRFRTHRSAALFARLACHPGRAFSRDELIESLWPDAEPEAGRQNLRQALSSLRSILEPTGVPSGSVLDADRVRVRLVPESIDCDAAQLTRATDVSDLETAISLYKGEFLPGSTDEWALEERQRLAELYVAALRTVAQKLRAHEESGRAIPYAQALVQANPLDEAAQGLLIRLYADTGRAEEAVQQYRDYRRILKRELGDEPDPRLKEIAMTLKGATGKLEVPILEERKPARQASLPVTLTRLFGRQEEIERITGLLTDGPRLLTLTGPGGTGKTRLAIESARAASDAFGQRVWFVPLADVRDAHLLPSRILDAIQSKETGPPIEAIAVSLGDRLALLVLDNLEQLLPTAAHTVQALLRRLPNLVVLVTSRRPLGLPGEQQLPVERLLVPAIQASHEDLAEYPSAQLFRDRAAHAAPGFRLSEKNAAAVATLCRQLEGLPLAIELAAAWSATFTPTQMVERMEKRFELLRETRLNKEERHASLWAAIDWSYSMLRPEAQRLFAQLSVFRGGWDLEAVEQISREPQAADLLEQLRLHALIHTDSWDEGMRWNMLESLREFAGAQLPPELRQQAIAAHASLFASRAQAWHELQRGSDLERVNRLFQADIENFWAVIDRGVEGVVPLQEAYVVTNGAYRFWEMRGAWAAVRRAYERLLEADAEKQPTAQRALALISLANLMRQQGEAEAAIAPTEECKRIRESLGDRAGVSSALGHLAQLHKALGDAQRAKQLYLECLAIQEETGARWSWGMNCMNLGWLLVLEKEWQEATEWLERSRNAMAELGDKWGVAAATGNLAEAALGQGHLTLASELHGRSLEAFVELEDLPAIAEELEGIAHVTHMQGSSAKAAVLYGAATALRRQIGSHISAQEASRLESRITQARSACAEFEERFQEGSGLSWQQALALIPSAPPSKSCA